MVLCASGGLPKKKSTDSPGIQSTRRALETPRIWEVVTDADSQVDLSGYNLQGIGYELDSFGVKVSDLIKNIYHATAINDAAQVLIGTSAKEKYFLEVTRLTEDWCIKPRFLMFLSGLNAFPQAGSHIKKR